MCLASITNPTHITDIHVITITKYPNWDVKNFFMRFQWGERKFLYNEKFLEFHGEKVHLQKEIFQLENYLLAAATHDHVELTVSSYISISFIVSPLLSQIMLFNVEVGEVFQWIFFLFLRWEKNLWLKLIIIKTYHKLANQESENEIVKSFKNYHCNEVKTQLWYNLKAMNKVKSWNHLWANSNLYLRWLNYMLDFS